MSRLGLYNITSDVESAVDHALNQISKNPYGFNITTLCRNPEQKNNFRVKGSKDGLSDSIYFEVPGCVDKELITVKMVDEDLVVKVKPFTRIEPTEEDDEFFNKTAMEWKMFIPQHKKIESVECELKNCILKVELKYKDTSAKVSWK